MNQNYQQGQQARREVLGEAYVESATGQVSDFTRPLQDLVTTYCWGEIWCRPGLARRDRSLVNLGMLTTLNRLTELRLHIRGALHNGLTTQQIGEVLLQTAVYCGVPAAIDAFKGQPDQVARSLGAPLGGAGCDVERRDRRSSREEPDMTSINIAVLDDYQHVALSMADWSGLQDRASIEVFSDTIAEPDALIARLQPFDVICVMRERTPLPRAILKRLPRLKLIVSTGPKNASIDHAAAEEHGIVVKDTRGSLAAPTELTWALIMASARHVAAEAASFRTGGWQRTVGDELKGRTLGVLGLGHIGGHIARIARAFDMAVITWSDRTTAEQATEVGATLVTKDRLFAEADIVTIHLVLVEATRGLVGAEELAAMKPTAWLVNTSRGPIVDEAALIAALRARMIGGAALDVFNVEPLPAGHPFRTLDNVVATPHLGYVSRQQYAVWYADTVDHIAAWLDERAGNS